MKAFVVWSAFFALALTQLHAAPPLLSEGFESYNRDDLAANYTPGANFATNGGPGNAWWSPFPPALTVVGAETLVIPGISTNLVNPHGGANMVRGENTGNVTFDQDFYNIAYRLNSSSLFTGNVTLDWWFYDPIGSASNPAKQYSDFVSLSCYPALPSNTDNAGGDNPDPGFPVGRLSLGASYETGAGFNPTNYQVQVLGATNGYNSDGWFDLTNTVRAIGWHHASIIVAPAISTNAPAALFFIDDMSNPVLTNSVVSTNGFNALELNSKFGNLTGYFDDLTFNVLPPPTLAITNSGGNTVLTWPAGGWILQTTTNLITTSFADVPGAVSPYTNIVPVSPQFFRLRH